MHYQNILKSEFIWQTASTEPDISDIYMRWIFPAGSNICFIQRAFHCIRIREIDSQNVLIHVYIYTYIYIRDTPWLGMSIISGCFRPTLNKGIDLSADRLYSFNVWYRVFPLWLNIFNIQSWTTEPHFSEVTSVSVRARPSSHLYHVQNVMKKAIRWPTYHFPYKTS